MLADVSERGGPLAHARLGLGGALDIPVLLDERREQIARFRLLSRIGVVQDLQPQPGERVVGVVRLPSLGGGAQRNAVIAVGQRLEAGEVLVTDLLAQLGELGRVLLLHLLVHLAAGNGAGGRPGGSAPHGAAGRGLDRIAAEDERGDGATDGAGHGAGAGALGGTFSGIGSAAAGDRRREHNHEPRGGRSHANQWVFPRHTCLLLVCLSGNTASAEGPIGIIRAAYRAC